MADGGVSDVISLGIAAKNVLLKGLALFDAGGANPAVSATEKQNQDMGLDRHGTM